MAVLTSASNVSGSATPDLQCFLEQLFVHFHSVQSVSICNACLTRSHPVNMTESNLSQSLKVTSKLAIDLRRRSQNAHQPPENGSL
jgi:hypothetical protein